MKHTKPYNIALIHGWADDPYQGWLFWLAQQLRDAGHNVVAPHFPREKLVNTDFARWQAMIHDAVSPLGDKSIIVAHSMGVPMILRYLSDYEGHPSIAGLICVAGISEYPVARPNPLFDPPLDFPKIRHMVQHRVSIYSNNDRSVPLSLTDKLAEDIDALKILDAGKGHFAGLRDVRELPSVLRAVHECMS